MNLKTSIALAIVFLVLGSFVFMDAIKWQPERMEEAELKQRLVDWNGKSIQSIRIVVPSEGRARSKASVQAQFLCKSTRGCDGGTDDEWQVMFGNNDGKETELPGDSAAIASIVQSIKTATRMEEPVTVAESERRLKNFGLGREQSRRIIIEFTNESSSQELVFGDQTAINSNYYLWNSAKPEVVEIVAYQFYRALDRDPFHWQNKALVPKLARAPRIKKLRWRAQNVGQWYSCERKVENTSDTANAKWTCRDQLVVQGEESLLERLSSEVQHAAALDSEERTVQINRILGGEPLLTIIADSESDSEPAELRFFQSGVSGRWLVHSTEVDWIGILKPDGYRSFLEPFAEFREKKLLSRAERDAIERVELREKNGAWREVANRALVDEFLTLSSRTVVTSFPSLRTPTGKNWRTKAQWNLRLSTGTPGADPKQFSVWIDPENKRALVDGEVTDELRELSANWQELFIKLTVANPKSVDQKESGV